MWDSGATNRVFDSLADVYLCNNELANCFDARATLARMLEFEAALAHAQAQLGMIPAPAAQHIAAACVVDGFDVEALKRDTSASSSAALPVVDALTALVAARNQEAALYVHWGSSTQDVMDSALMLQARSGLDQLLLRLAHITTTLAELTRTHRETLMVARTLSQHALPTTFGYKCALWLEAMLSAHTELKRQRSSLPLQFGGAAGTLAAYGARGLELRDVLARNLGLAAVLPWHTDRTVIRALAAALAITAASAGKLANDLILMNQSEVGELREAAGVGRGGSTALPHKRNPVAAMAVVAGAHRMPGQLAALFFCFDHGHERASGAWHAEWQSLRELFVTLGAMLAQLDIALSGIEVNTLAMRANLDRSGGLIMAEAVVMALAPALGRSAAQAVVKRAVIQASVEERLLYAVLREDPAVKQLLSDAALAQTMDPQTYLGSHSTMVDAVLARYERVLVGL